MQIFELQADSNNYQGLTNKNTKYLEQETKITDNTNLNRVSDTWKPLELQFCGKGKRGDCPSFLFFLPIFSERAVNNLKYLMGESIEFLPVICPGKISYFAVNVLKVVDCINCNKAETIRFRSGRLMKFTKYAFHEELLENIHIFKIPDLQFSPIFVSEMFVNRVNDSGLLGFDFVEVWK